MTITHKHPQHAFKILEPIVLGWTRDHDKGKIVNLHPVEVANSLTSCKRENTTQYVLDGFRIRKLTERECFRLMGLHDDEIDKIQAAGISRTRQYMLSGNSIVVNCLAAIFKQLLIGNTNADQHLITEINNIKLSTIMKTTKSPFALRLIKRKKNRHICFLYQKVCVTRQ